MRARACCRLNGGLTFIGGRCLSRDVMRMCSSVRAPLGRRMAVIVVAMAARQIREDDQESVSDAQEVKQHLKPACLAATMEPRMAPTMRSTITDRMNARRYHDHNAEREERPLKFVRFKAPDEIAWPKVMSCDFFGEPLIEVAANSSRYSPEGQGVSVPQLL